MNRVRLLTALLAGSLLLTAGISSAQNRRDRRDRSDRNDRGVEMESAGTQPSGGGAAPTPSQAPSGRLEDQYGVLLKRSIFARTGNAAPGPEQAATRTTAPSAPVLSPEQSVVFVGVIAQDDEYVAFAENQTTHQLTILRTGDDVARGKVVAITLDTLAYGSGGAIKEVHLGQNLAGELVSTSFASSGTGSTPTTGPAGSGTPSAPSTAGMTPEQAAIMERMRQRRLSGQ